MIEEEKDIFSRYKLSDILTASPYHRRHNLDGNLSEEIFKEKLFVEYEYYSLLKEELDTVINSKAETRPFVLFLSGYAGTGKTTFMHWYCNSKQSELNYAFLDFTATTSFVHKKEEGKKDYQYKLENYLRKKVEAIYTAYQDYFNDLLNHISENVVTYNSFFSDDFREDLSICCEEFNSSNLTKYIAIFINSIQYSELLLLLLLFYNKYSLPFLEQTNGNSKEGKLFNKNLLLNIDNIDGIEMESYSKLIPQYIINIYELYLDIISITDYFDETKKIDFVYTMRDTIHSVINPQDEDYYYVKNLKFSPNINSTDQTRKRLEFAVEKKIEIEKNVSALFNFIIKDDDRASRNSYLPLFNFNNRKFNNYIYNIAVENNIFLDTIIHLIDARVRIGARGILYFLFIRYMKTSDYFKEAFFFEEGIFVEEDGKKAQINIARIILTILNSMGKYYIDIEQKADYSNKVGLFSLYQEYLKIFNNVSNKEQKFLRMIAKLFLFHERNWCHLISISNKSIIDENDFDDEQGLLMQYYDTSDHAERSHIKRTLNRISININAAGYIYLKDIVRHYEFFSIRCNQKPLFASTAIKDDGPLHFEFEDNLIKTFEIAEACISSLYEFLEIKRHSNFEQETYCFRVYNKSDFLEDEYDVNESFYEKPGRLFINRVVDFHTEYIDWFRFYILNNNELIQSYSSKSGLNKDIVKYRINSKIISIIEKYLALYYIRDDMQFEKRLQTLQKLNIQKIQTDSKAGKYCLRINSLRDETFK